MGELARAGREAGVGDAVSAPEVARRRLAVPFVLPLLTAEARAFVLLRRASGHPAVRPHTPKLAAASSLARKGKSFRPPAEGESLSLCVLKEKVTKEKEHPTWRLPGILPVKSVSRGRAFRTDILSVRKGIDIPVDARSAACRPRLTAAQGPRVEQRAIVARTIQKSRSKTEWRVRTAMFFTRARDAEPLADRPLATQSGHSDATGLRRNRTRQHTPTSATHPPLARTPASAVGGWDSRGGSRRRADTSQPARERGAPLRCGG